VAIKKQAATMFCAKNVHRLTESVTETLPVSLSRGACPLLVAA
jgi:hypothetical protein